MQATRRLFQYKPMIRFLGRRSIPQQIDHTPKPHPASPSNSLPDSFAAYRQKAQQHGPLTRHHFSTVGGPIGGHSASELGPIKPGPGEFLDRNELPSRFHRRPWSPDEIEAVESGGASLVA